jgi:hypothetical protein
MTIALSMISYGTTGGFCIVEFTKAIASWLSRLTIKHQSSRIEI